MIKRIVSVLILFQLSLHGSLPVVGTVCSATGTSCMVTNHASICYGCALGLQATRCYMSEKQKNLRNAKQDDDTFCFDRYNTTIAASMCLINQPLLACGVSCVGCLRDCDQFAESRLERKQLRKQAKREKREKINS